MVGGATVGFLGILLGRILTEGHGDQSPRHWRRRARAGADLHRRRPWRPARPTGTGLSARSSSAPSPSCRQDAESVARLSRLQSNAPDAAARGPGRQPGHGPRDTPPERPVRSTPLRKARLLGPALRALLLPSCVLCVDAWVYSCKRAPNSKGLRIRRAETPGQKTPSLLGHVDDGGAW